MHSLFSINFVFFFFAFFINFLLILHSFTSTIVYLLFLFLIFFCCFSIFILIKDICSTTFNFILLFIIFLLTFLFLFAFLKRQQNILAFLLTCIIFIVLFNSFAIFIYFPILQDTINPTFVSDLCVHHLTSTKLYFSYIDFYNWVYTMYVYIFEYICMYMYCEQEDIVFFFIFNLNY